MVKDCRMEHSFDDSQKDHPPFGENPETCHAGTKCKYSPELKMRVVLDSLRADRTQAAVSEEHNVSQPLISIWKRRALQAMMTSLSADYRREGRRYTLAQKVILSRSVVESRELSRELRSLKASLSKLSSILESGERDVHAG